MSDLWIILVLLGVAIVLGIVLFNWWQEKKYRSRVEHHFKNSRRDVLIDDFEINADVLKHEKDIFLDASAKQVVHEALDDAMVLSGLSDETELISSESSNISRSENPSFRLSSHKEKSKASARTKKEASASLFEEEPTSTLTKSNQTESNQHNSDSEQTEETFSLLASQIEVDDDLSGDIGNNDQDMEVATKQSSSNEQASLSQLPIQLHSQIDLIAILYAREGVTAEQLLPLLAELDTFEQNNFALAKPKDGMWIDLKNNKKASTTNLEQVVCSLQLADRSGAVDRAIIFRFQHSIETLGLNLGLHVEWHGGNDALQQAQSIDQFCIEVDKAVEFHVVANQGAFHATKFRGLAEASGLNLSEEGKYELRNVEGHLNFCIRNFEGKPLSADMLKTAVMTGFTFQLDIPTVAQNTQIFDQMVNIAQSMASSLEATMIDVNRRPIGDVQLDKIRQQLKVINATMIAKGIIPGSPQALRLFS